MKTVDFGAARRKAKDAERVQAVANDIDAKAAKAARTYTRAEVNHRVWRSSAISWAFGIACGAAFTLGVWLIIGSTTAEQTARQATEVFSRGVAVGQVIGEDDDQGVDRPGREPRSAP